MESYADLDLATLRAIARGANVPGADRMSHDELVGALRWVGADQPTGEPVDTKLSDPNDPETDAGLYHGQGVGRRERRA
ncbi:hypothetical protein AB0J86_03945 [Micromonospora sp. NPDC049559]|uniref:hypothetical protein n=1 Tax=Micromonospora sp. NPDC049559 TaxID=3155923 RepID=UPI00342C21F7